MTAPAAASPSRTPFKLNRSTTPRKAAVSISSFVALAYALCALAKGIRSPPTMATRLTAEPTSIDPSPHDSSALRIQGIISYFLGVGTRPAFKPAALPLARAGALSFWAPPPPNGPHTHGRIHHDNGARRP